MPLPTFIGIGVMKCGTTSLYDFLKGHPDVFLSTEKEIHYWDKAKREPLAAYAKAFAGSDGYKAIGEITPSYIAQRGALAAIATALPDAKVVVLLRDPVSRAVSQLKHIARSRSPKLPGEDGKVAFFDMHKHLDKELDVIERLSDRSFTAPSLNVLRRGHYVEQLELVEQYFSGKSLVHKFEDAIADTPEFNARISEFLEIPVVPMEWPHSNPGKRRVTLQRGISDRLTEYYESWNSRLSERFGIDY